MNEWIMPPLSCSARFSSACAVISMPLVNPRRLSLRCLPFPKKEIVVWKSPGAWLFAVVNTDAGCELGSQNAHNLPIKHMPHSREWQGVTSRELALAGWSVTCSVETRACRRLYIPISSPRQESPMAAGWQRELHSVLLQGELSGVRSHVLSFHAFLFSPVMEPACSAWLFLLHLCEGP